MRLIEHNIVSCEECSTVSRSGEAGGKNMISLAAKIRNQAQKRSDFLRKYLDNQYERDDFVSRELAQLAPGLRILDAGAGSQRYRNDCRHLDYVSQDFGNYRSDEKPSLTTANGSAQCQYEYGATDIIGNIWDIDVRDSTFDVVLCTEVIEHIPYPIEAVRELGRVLKPGGLMILTAPSNCLRHFDPYFYTTGFSDRWFEAILPLHGFTISQLEPVGDYYRWMAVELARTAKNSGLLAASALAPAFIYFYRKHATELSVNTLCMGYHVLARKTSTVAQ